jgi:cytoskeletal protein RodZ
MKICPICKKQCEDTYAYCDNCGGSLVSFGDITQQVSAQPQQDAPVPQQGYYEPVNNQVYPEVTSSVTGNAATKSNRPIWIALISVLGALVLILLGLLILFLMMGNRKESAHQAIAVYDTAISSEPSVTEFQVLEHTDAINTTPLVTTAPQEEDFVVIRTTRGNAVVTTTTKKAETTVDGYSHHHDDVIVTTTTKQKTTTTVPTKALTTTTVTTTTTPVVTTTLPVIYMNDYVQDYVIANGHTYVLVNEGVSWNTAYARCSGWGGHLAVVESADEQQVLTQLAASSTDRANIWIGGYYDVGANTWKWVNGAPFSYTNWDLDQPDNYFGNEYYIRFANGDQIYSDWEAIGSRWNDTCENGDTESAPLSTFAFICEFDYEATIQ